MTPAAFDPAKYKSMTHDQWQAAAEAWHRWSPTLSAWLGPATEMMLDLTGIGPGSRVLVVAAGAGEETLRTARRVGPTGYVLATDISANILEYAKTEFTQAGLTNVEARVLDGEDLEALPAGDFDAVISRVGLIYFPDQQKALRGMRRALKPGGRVGAIVYSTAARNEFFSIPISLVRQRAQLPPPLPGQPGPFSLGQPGVLTGSFSQAGFHEVEVRTLSAPVHLPSTEEFLRFARESFGALHQMMSGLNEAEREATWLEMAQQLRQFETAEGFAGPCELLIGVGTKLA